MLLPRSLAGSSGSCAEAALTITHAAPAATTNGTAATIDLLTLIRTLLASLHTARGNSRSYCTTLGNSPRHGVSNNGALFRAWGALKAPETIDLDDESAILERRKPRETRVPFVGVDHKELAAWQVFPAIAQVAAEARIGGVVLEQRA